MTHKSAQSFFPSVKFRFDENTHIYRHEEISRTRLLRDMRCDWPIEVLRTQTNEPRRDGNTLQPHTAAQTNKLNATIELNQTNKRNNKKIQ